MWGGKLSWRGNYWENMSGGNVPHSLAFIRVTDSTFLSADRLGRDRKQKKPEAALFTPWSLSLGWRLLPEVTQWLQLLCFLGTSISSDAYLAHSEFHEVTPWKQSPPDISPKENPPEVIRAVCTTFLTLLEVSRHICRLGLKGIPTYISS